jgi:2-polyprenyl-3-methyl-5-hydroxy-6-metoxy-1,4-benzoquinol methylase
MNKTLLETYNEIASDFYEDHKNDHWSNLRVQTFASYFKPGAKIMDIGCGPGIKSDVLLAKGLDVYGTDFSLEMIRIARENYPHGRFDVLDINNVAGLQETFDGILAFAVLLHLPKTTTAGIVKDLVSKLNPSGFLMVAVKTQRPNEKDEVIVTEDDYGYAYERFFSFYKHEEMRSYLTEAGLEICHHERFPPAEKSWSIFIGRNL